MENHGWTRCKDQLPEPGQIVYYFGPYIGIGIGRFDPTIQTQCYHEDENGNLVVEEMSQKLIDMINHNKFINTRFGVVDADDAPFWREYNEENAKGWCPIPPDYITLEERLAQDAQK
jgi:hypothetical protein